MLNFACNVVPGRAFCRRLIDSTCKVKQSWHIIRVSVEMKADLQVLLTFLKDYSGVSVMLDQFWTSNETLQLFTDRSDGIGNGFGIFFNNKWTHGKWSAHWVENEILRDITFLELFPVVVALEIWGTNLQNKKILFNIDNQAVVAILNKISCKVPRIMYLVRRLVLLSLRFNILIKVQHIAGSSNGIADALSRCNFQPFRKLFPFADQYPEVIPYHLWQI